MNFFSFLFFLIFLRTIVDLFHNGSEYFLLIHRYYRIAPVNFFLSLCYLYSMPCNTYAGFFSHILWCLSLFFELIVFIPDANIFFLYIVNFLGLFVILYCDTMKHLDWFSFYILRCLFSFFAVILLFHPNFDCSLFLRFFRQHISLNSNTLHRLFVPCTGLILGNNL